MKIAIAGATGFVGRALCQALATQHDVRALTRSASVRHGENEAWVHQVSWRQTDLFSLRDTETALHGTDVAFYLIHSMSPSARLSQGSFADMDLVLADNFARAARKAEVKRIVYLGGLVPEASPLSEHLASRLEVEKTLEHFGTPVTAIRAGLIIGAEGSSFQILVKLTRRLPLMLCPAWTATESQPIALPDVVRLLVAAAEHDAALGPVDAGGPDVLTYRGMLAETARAQGHRLRALNIPLFTPGLSALWVSLISQTSRALVSPLVQSLKHRMVMGTSHKQNALGGTSVLFVDAVSDALASQPPLRDKTLAVSEGNTEAVHRHTVRSVQRLPLPPGRDAAWVARAYVRWLPRFFRTLVFVELDDRRIFFRVRGWSPALLELEFAHGRSNSERQLFWIRGGQLADVKKSPSGRLEFRTTSDGKSILAMVHDFHPTLPWRIYVVTQAQAHRFVMWAFSRYLRKEASRTPDTQE